MCVGFIGRRELLVLVGWVSGWMDGVSGLGRMDGCAGANEGGREYMRKVVSRHNG